MEQDGKQFESNSNAFEEANVEANNALVMHNSNTHNNTKGLEDSDFFEDPNGKIGHISGGEIGPNN